MNRLEVDRALGQTPCICGDVEAWHPKCYAKFLGRPKHEVDAAMDRAYRTARRKLRERAKVQAGEALMMANVELTGAAAGLLPQCPATEGSEVERRVVRQKVAE